MSNDEAKYPIIDVDNLDVDYTDGIICPWCGFRHEEPEHIMDNITESEEEIECYQCERKFNVEPEVTVRYSTSRTECDVCNNRKLHSAGISTRPYHSNEDEQWRVVMECNMCGNNSFIYEPLTLTEQHVIKNGGKESLKYKGKYRNGTN